MTTLVAGSLPAVDRLLERALGAGSVSAASLAAAADEAAKLSVDRPLSLGVTVLTSVSAQDIAAAGFRGDTLAVQVGGRTDAGVLVNINIRVAEHALDENGNGGIAEGLVM